MPKHLLVVINKDGDSIEPSETFLQTHIDGLPCKITTLIGNPLYRKIIGEDECYIPSRSIFPIVQRWLLRRLKLVTVHQQDTSALVCFFKKNAFDAVLAEYGHTSATIADACFKAGVPLIAHFHGWDAYSDYMLTTYKNLYENLFVKSSAIIAVSNHMRDQLIALGAPSNKTFHNSCGADLPDDLVANPGHSDIRFIMVGRLTEKKAPCCSILAFAEVAKAYSGAFLDIVGDGPLMSTCEQLVKGLGLCNNIKFHGVQSHSTVYRIMSKARCFIQHSVRAKDGDHEGTPVSVLEAMGMGLPVVATKHGGIMDVITSSDLGLLVNEFDVPEMVKSMMIYAKNPELAQQIGKNARQEIVNEWSKEKRIENLWTILSDTINSDTIKSRKLPRLMKIGTKRDKQ